MESEGFFFWRLFDRSTLPRSSTRCVARKSQAVRISPNDAGLNELNLELNLLKCLQAGNAMPARGALLKMIPAGHMALLLNPRVQFRRITASLFRKGVPAGPVPPVDRALLRESRAPVPLAAGARL